jgi:hypothetical protein
MGEVKETEERAMRVAIEYEKTSGRLVKVVAGTGCGYDLESQSADGTHIRHIEVKGRGKINAPHVFLTDDELSLARTDENYWLYLVFGPEKEFRFFVVPGKIAAQKVEQEIKWKLRSGKWLGSFCI